MEEGSMKNITRLLTVAFVVVVITAMYTTGRSQQLSFDQDVDNIWASEHNIVFDENTYCLAEAIYFEAGNQPVAGKVAVGSVILNRMFAEEYPDAVCGVVHQGPVRESWKKNGTFYPIRHKCQFSYWCDGLSDTPKFGPTWNDCLDIAGWLIDGDRHADASIIDITDGATHYHATYVSPSWSKALQKVVQIEAHIFYK